MEAKRIPELETIDWTYAMRREMQEIVPGLYLGPYSVATKSKCDYLEKHGITHIICVRQDIESHLVRTHFINKFKYLVLNIADTVTENIIQHLPKIRQFLDECFWSGGKALIHGNAGISRSAALALGYVMEKYSLSYKEAFQVVQQRRFCINPNEGFVQQLDEYEPIYRAQQMSRINGQCSLREDSRWKRKREANDNDSMIE